MLLCTFLLASVGWAMAEENDGGTIEITTLDGLKAAISNTELSTITLGSNIENVTEAITINRALTLDGKGNTISGTAAQNIIVIAKAGVTLKNVTIINSTNVTPAAGTGYNDVTVFQTGIEKETTLENVTLQGNGGIGLVVNGSNVKIKNVNASNHVWGSVNLQANGNVAPALTVVGDGKLAGLMQIYVDPGKNTDRSWVTATNYTYTEDYNTYASGLWTNKIGSDGSYLVDYASELQAVIGFINASEATSPFSTIKLAAGTYELSSQLTINKAITLEGAVDSDGAPTTTLKRTEAWSGTNESTKHMVCITAPEAAVSNLIIDGNNLTSGVTSPTYEGSGIQVYENNTNVNLNNVTVKNMLAAGLIVNSAKVSLTNFHTEGNTWGGVNVDKKATNNPELTVGTGCSFAEINKIWDESKVDNAVSFTTTGKWTKTTLNNVNYWTNSALTLEARGNTPAEGYRLYANGNPITIEAAPNDENEQNIIVYRNNDPSDSYTLNGSTTLIYGGSSASSTAEITSTSVTMNSGKLLAIYGGGSKDITGNTSVVINGGSLAQIAGGGSSSKVNGNVSITAKNASISNIFIGGGIGGSTAKSADVTGKITINVENVDIDYFVTGGYNYSKVNEVEVISSNATYNTFLGGGYAPTDAGNNLETAYEDNANNVAKTTLSIAGGTVNDAMYVGGGFSYAYVKTANAILNGVTFNGGLYGAGYNGRTEIADVEVKGCTFNMKSGDDPDYRTIAGIIRGKVLNSLTMSFDDKCTFAENYEAYLGCDRDSEGNPIPYAANAIWFFQGTSVPTVKVSEGMHNVTVTGAPVVVEKFLHKKSSDTWVNAFEVPVGNTWTFNGGVTIQDDVTLTNKGTIVIPAASVHAVASKAGGNIVVSPATTTMQQVVEAMNNSTETKSDLKDKTFSIECQDGVIASNKSVAAELAAAGKVVKVLKFTSNETSSSYSLSEETVQEAAKITNLPDELAYGTQPITLAFNRKGFTASIEGTSDVASIENGVLTIKKPGEVTIKLTKANSESEEAENYTQKLKVTKRIVTLTEGLTVSYSDGKNSKEYDGTKSITLAKGSLKFAGMLGGNETSGLGLADGFTGTMADANVGEGKLVTIANAKLVQGSDDKDSTDFYELAPITIVKATVTPKPITITATDKSVAYGETVEYAVDDYSSSLVSGDKLDGTLKFSCAVKTDTTATNYPSAITPYGLTSPNYAITFVAGKLTVTAIAPSIEITEAKVVQSGTNKNIEFKARLIHNGGAAVTAVTFKNGETDVPATLENDIYSGKIENVQSDSETNYTLKAVATNSAGNGEASVSLKVDAKTPQNLSWAPSVLPTLVYGQEMTLAATSDQPAANGAYTYSVVAENGETPITDGVLKATKVGKVTIKAERAADADHSAATLTKTIEITPKPITVSVTGLEKFYDGTTKINVTPTFTLSGVESGDDVSVNKANLTLSYASKNAGDNVAVILPELTLTGANAANYTLVQPKNVTGKITKPRLTIKVKDVTRPWNQRHTKYEFETTGLVNNETLAQAYSGTLAVAEEDGVLKLTVEANKSQNYDVTAENGTLTITKGMPKAVVYGSGNDWNGMIVDYQGYDSNDLTLDNTNVASGGKALVKLNGTVLTSSINSKPSTSSSSANAASFSLRSASLRAGTFEWDGAFNEIEYGTAAQDLTCSETGTYTYESTNMSVLTYAGGKITPVGVGNATIIATSGTEVHICNFTVKPKSLGMTATEMDKTYDGTATANGTVSLDAGDIVGTDDVALDLSGITFNYADKNVADGKAIEPSQNLVLIGTNANNYTLSRSLTGKITQKTLIVNDPIAVYYNGQATHTLTTYPATGLVAGDVAPITVTFADAAVGTRNISSIALTSTGDAANYKLATPLPTNGTIQRSTLVATLPTNASSVNDLKNNITLAIRETGEAVTASAVGFVPTITTTGSGTNTVYSVTGGETTNYSVVYNRNQIGYAAAPVIPGGGGGGSSEPETPETPTTPGTPTGVESISEGSQLYTVKGAVVVSPAEPLRVAIYSVTGQTLFNDEVSYLTQVPAKAGIYVVVIQKGNDRITEKVFVK